MECGEKQVLKHWDMKPAYEGHTDTILDAAKLRLLQSITKTSMEEAVLRASGERDQPYQADQYQVTRRKKDKPYDLRFRTGESMRRLDRVVASRNLSSSTKVILNISIFRRKTRWSGT
jgi:hypothetical protein